MKFGGEHRRYYDNFYSEGGGTNVMNFMVNPLHQFQGDFGLGANEGRVLGLGSFLLGINNRNNVAKPDQPLHEHELLGRRSFRTTGR